MAKHNKLYILRLDHLKFELREKIKHEAIAHWEDNLKKAKKLDWSAWSKCEYPVKREALGSVHPNVRTTDSRYADNPRKEK